MVVIELWNGIACGACCGGCIRNIHIRFFGVFYIYILDSFANTIVCLRSNVEHGVAIVHIEAVRDTASICIINST